MKGSSLVSYGHIEATSFEDNEAIASEFKIEAVPLRRIADRSLTTRLNVPVVRFNEDLSPSDLTK